MTPEHRVHYEDGYRDGESNMAADYQFALTEHGGMDDDADTSPSAVAKEMADLRKQLQDELGDRKMDLDVARSSLQGLIRVAKILNLDEKTVELGCVERAATELRERVQKAEQMAVGWEESSAYYRKKRQELRDELFARPGRMDPMPKDIGLMLDAIERDGKSEIARFLREHIERLVDACPLTPMDVIRQMQALGYEVMITRKTHEGTIVDVATGERALSADEIKTLYEQGPDGG